MQVPSSGNSVLENSGGRYILLACETVAMKVDRYPTGSRVDVWWPGDEEWYTASVLKTRTEPHTIDGTKALSALVPISATRAHRFGHVGGLNLFAYTARLAACYER